MITVVQKVLGIYYSTPIILGIPLQVALSLKPIHSAKQLVGRQEGKRTEKL